MALESGIAPGLKSSSGRIRRPQAVQPEGQEEAKELVFPLLALRLRA
jgi:hypothetical protein